MELNSSVFENGGEIPKKYTCKGEDISPPISFHKVPDNCKSLVLIMEDPDAPLKTFIHWMVWNIPKDKKGFSEGEKIEFPQGRNGFRKIGYMGPCPPFGRHRYIFKLFAIDKKINLPHGSKIKSVKKELESHIIDKAELLGTYKKDIF